MIKNVGYMDYSSVDISKIDIWTLPDTKEVVYHMDDLSDNIPIVIQSLHLDRKNVSSAFAINFLDSLGPFQFFKWYTQFQAISN